VEATSIQVCWAAAPPGRLTVDAGEAAVSIDGAGGAGGLVVDGLRPGATVAVRLRAEGHPPVGLGHVTTLRPPPGRELCRFAAFNDLHIGAREFGTLRPLREADHADPHPVRCARAAVAEAAAWGATAFVVKGDLTQAGRPNEWAAVADLLAAPGLPVLAIEGNHETKLASVDGRAIMAARGLRLVVRPGVLDLPGIRVVGVPTARWHGNPGWISREAIGESASLIHDAPAAFVALHHYPQRFRFPTLYPTGIPGNVAHRALDAWADANPATLVVAGHSHRHRRHDYRTLVLAESGSTKDFPGSWTGYTVYEGGIMQTTRRVLDPAAIAWTEQGRHVLGGVWGWWAPGLRSHRCYTHPGPPRR